MAASPLVLVVEDDQTLVNVLIRNLEARGFRTAGASSVRAGVDMLVQTRPSLLVLDIDLPDGSGWEIGRVLRHGNLSHVPIIVISALRPNARLVAEFGCIGVLEKPFPMESLLRMVMAALTAPRTVAGHSV